MFIFKLWWYRKIYLHFEKVKKLFSMTVALLNDLLSFRAFRYWVVRKITTCRIAIGRQPFTLAKGIPEPNTTSHGPHCFLPVPQAVGGRLRGGNKTARGLGFRSIGLYCPSTHCSRPRVKNKRALTPLWKLRRNNGPART